MSELARLIPDPAYLLVPFVAILGGLLWATWKLLDEPEPDLGRAWFRGSVVGGWVGVGLTVLALIAGVR